MIRFPNEAGFKFLCLLMLTATALPLMGCGGTQIPEISGHILDRESGRPVADVSIVITYIGNTRSREMWFHAATDLPASRCVRTLTTSDETGRFSIPAQHRAAYFGDPTVRFRLFHPSFRYQVSGSEQDLNSEYELLMWPESAAERYDSYLGELVDYGNVADPEQFREWQRDRHRYIDMWLANGSVASTCDYENDSGETERFVLGLFEEWVDTAPQSADRRSAFPACAELRSFRPELTRADDADRLQRIRRIAAEKMCVP